MLAISIKNIAIEYLYFLHIEYINITISINITNNIGSPASEESPENGNKNIVSINIKISSTVSDSNIFFHVYRLF